jgi:hypothetical protein
LSDILYSWKSYTASKANKILGRKGNSFWQVESYDHLVRDDEDMARCCHYTTMNPANARLCSQPEDWKWSGLYRPATDPLVAQASQLAGSGSILAPRFVRPEHGAGMLREPAGTDACATFSGRFRIEPTLPSFASLFCSRGRG